VGGRQSFSRPTRSAAPQRLSSLSARSSPVTDEYSLEAVPAPKPTGSAGSRDSFLDNLTYDGTGTGGARDRATSASRSQRTTTLAELSDQFYSETPGALSEEEERTEAGTETQTSDGDTATVSFVKIQMQARAVRDIAVCRGQPAVFARVIVGGGAASFR
jgi:hypothetical protein